MSYKVTDSRASQQPTDLGEVSHALETSREAREMISRALGVPVELLEPVRTAYAESLDYRKRFWADMLRRDFGFDAEPRMLDGYPVVAVEDENLDHGDVFMRAPKRVDFDGFKREYMNTPMLAEEEDDDDDYRRRADEKGRRRWERAQAQEDFRRPRRID